MAKKKPATAKPRKRRTIGAVKSATRRKSSGRTSMQGVVMDLAKGVIGAVLVAKVGPMVPVKDARMRYGLLAAASALMAARPGPLRAVGIGAGIASGTLLAGEFMPDLLAPMNTGATVGRLTPETVRRMQMAAQQVRQGIAGPRQRTVVGTGDGGEYPQPVNGTRNRTIVGSGEQDVY